MSFFKPRRETIDFETQEDLPRYHFDVNGFLIFDDSSLGGCGMFRVIPMAMTSSVTHRETLGSSTRDTAAQGYRPNRVMEEYGDRRADAIMQWVNLINSLQPMDDVDQQTHVQIILKKTRPEEWETAPGHEICSLVGMSNRHGDKTSRAMGRYQDSYIELLRSIDDAMFERRGKWNGSSYAMGMYIVVSYTPSSEGWWMDGRDDDYYVKDTPSKRQLFDVDGLVERMGDIIVNRKERRTERHETNTADALYPIEEDRIAQVIQTRMHKIEQSMIKYASEIGDESLAFEIRRTHMMDNTALLAFWDNPLTPYRNRIWNLQTNMDDVILALRREESIATSDLSHLEDGGDDASDAIGEFLSRYAGKTADEVMLGDNGEDRLSRRQDGATTIDESVAGAWHDIDPTLSVTTNAETSERQQFIDRYSRRTIGATRTKEAMESAVRGQDVMALRDKIGDNASYGQLLLSESVAEGLRETRIRERQERERWNLDQLGQLGEAVSEDAPAHALDAMARGRRSSLSSEDKNIVIPKFANGSETGASDIIGQYAASNYTSTSDKEGEVPVNDMQEASSTQTDVPDITGGDAILAPPTASSDERGHDRHVAGLKGRIRVGAPSGVSVSQGFAGRTRHPKRITIKADGADAVHHNDMDVQSSSQDNGKDSVTRHGQRRITIPKKGR